MLRTARLVLVALLAVTVAALVPAGVAGAQSAEARLIYLAFPRNHPVWLLPVRILVTEGVSPYRDVLDILCREPGDDTVVGFVLPRGSRVERLSVAEGTATVDLKLGRPEPRGQAAELAVQAIAHTLGQFPEIRRVLVRVDGHPWPRPGSSGGQAGEFPPPGGGPAGADPGAGGGA
ncbi:MAG: GerMN domain-containing protein, partial [Bacillota bacterium]|nr:GerMN domain-containing protein [Bacillota bacterium]